jgi:hypothetical protein
VEHVHVDVNEPKKRTPELRKISPETPCESERKYFGINLKLLIVFLFGICIRVVL